MCFLVANNQDIIFHCKPWHVSLSEILLYGNIPYVILLFISICWVENLAQTSTRKRHLRIRGHSNQNRTRVAWTYFNKQWVIKWNSCEAQCKQSYEQALFDNWRVPFLRLCKKKLTVFNF